MKKAVEEFSGGALCCRGFTVWTEGADPTEAIAGVLIDQVEAADFGDSHLSMVQGEAVVRARERYQRALRDTPDLFDRLEKRYKGLRVLPKPAAVGLVLSYDYQSEATLWRGEVGALQLSKSGDWSLELPAGVEAPEVVTRALDFKELKLGYNNESENGQYSRREIKSGMREEDDHNKRFKVVQLLELGMQARVLDIYNKGLRRYTVLCGAAICTLLEGDVTRLFSEAEVDAGEREVCYQLLVISD